MTEHLEDHDRGLQFDLETMQNRQAERRRLLGWIASGGTAALLSACGGGSSDGSSSSSSSSTSTSTTTSTTTSTSTTTTGTSSDGSTCLVDPTETQGPYPADGSNSVSGSVVNVLSESGVVRSDIRSSFGDSTTTAAGVTVTLTITAVNVNDACAALEGYAVYFWQCNAEGEYSLYASDIQDENYLRGVQETDSNGQCTFVTIFPACYDGRWPHMHFEVYPSLDSATSYTNKVLTSQMCMPEDTCDEVYALSTYDGSTSNLAKVSISSDGIFGDNSDDEITWMTPTFSGDTSSGYTATISIGLAV